MEGGGVEKEVPRELSPWEGKEMILRGKGKRKNKGGSGNGGKKGLTVLFGVK